MQFFHFKKLKNIFNKNILKIALVVFCLGFLIFSPKYVFNKNNFNFDANKYFQNSKSQNIVLTLWHIETFEGGSASRSSFLERQAKKFNKQNQSCFINVLSMNDVQLVENLSQGLLPDMFSFGVGVGDLVFQYIEELPKNSNIRKDLSSYGMVGNDVFAYPYILSGYCLISNESLTQDKENSNDLNALCKQNKNTKTKGISLSVGEYNNSLSALLKNDVCFTEVDANIVDSSYEAYLQFVSKKSVSLLGTARDVARCKGREENGSISSLLYNFLPGYSDLVQYVSVCKNLSILKNKLAVEFSNFLTEQTCQNDLKNFGLFSIDNNYIYQSDYMLEFEKALKKDLVSVNVFKDSESLKRDIKNSLEKLIVI